MAGVWLSTALGDELVRGESVLKNLSDVVADLIAGQIDITTLVQNMSSVLTHKEAECRERGMTFFTRILQALPPDFFSEQQLKFIVNFYTDRLKDNHRVIPAVIAGYLAVIEMKNFPVSSVAEFFSVLFREVPCQSQLRVDRYNIYSIIQRLLETQLPYMKTLGPDFVFGVISAMDGERDPRNLMFLFAFLPKFMRSVPLGHLVEEMFEVVSCYYPIDFNAVPGDPDAVSRQDLATALAPCLCAVPEFGEQCLLLLVEKLDSSLRLAKIDSLQLLVQSCNVFDTNTYTPFLKTLWASLQRELANKTDDELKLAAHKALYALVHKLSQVEGTDQTFENFVKGVLIFGQTTLADATTTIIFDQASKTLLTTANASRPSCLIIVKAMIPSTIAYYSLKMGDRVQVAALDLLVRLMEVARHWEVLEEVRSQIEEIPHLCLNVINEPKKDHQIAGLKTVVGALEALKEELVLPLIEVLTYNVQHAQDDDLIAASVECIHAMATKYPELMMDVVVTKKFNLDAITDNKEMLRKRLRVLSKLASLNYFTDTIMEKILMIIKTDEANVALNVLSSSISDITLYSEEKIEQIERDHNLVDSILIWLLKEVSNSASPETLTYGYSLIATTISRLSSVKQSQLIEKHTDTILNKCHDHQSYLLILEALYNSLRQNVVGKFNEVMDLSITCALANENEFLRSKACNLMAHLINKVGTEEDFNEMHETVRKAVNIVSNEDNSYPRVIHLSGWMTKSLILRSSNCFAEWLEKIVLAISNEKWCLGAADAIKLLMTDDPKSLNPQCHCRVSLFYKQRIFQTFLTLSEGISTTSDQTKDAYLLSMAYILGHIPKSVLLSQIDKIADLIIESLVSNNRELLAVMLRVAEQTVHHPRLAASLQTLLPRLLALTTYPHCMEVRLSSLACVLEAARALPTVALLPHRAAAVAALAAPLDDRKRLVRAAAVRARSRWLLVGAPGEEAA